MNAGVCGGLSARSIRSMSGNVELRSANLDGDGGQPSNYRKYNNCKEESEPPLMSAFRAAEAEVGRGYSHEVHVPRGQKKECSAFVHPKSPANDLSPTVMTGLARPALSDEGVVWFGGLEVSDAL